MNPWAYRMLCTVGFGIGYFIGIPFQNYVAPALPDIVNNIVFYIVASSVVFLTLGEIERELFWEKTMGFKLKMRQISPFTSYIIIGLWFQAVLLR